MPRKSLLDLEQAYRQQRTHLVAFRRTCHFDGLLSSAIHDPWTGEHRTQAFKTQAYKTQTLIASDLMSEAIDQIIIAKPNQKRRCSKFSSDMAGKVEEQFHPLSHGFLIYRFAFWSYSGHRSQPITSVLVTLAHGAESLVHGGAVKRSRQLTQQL